MAIDLSFPHHFELLQPFYVFNTCEEKYKYSDFIKEFWAVITSLFYFIPYFYVRFVQAKHRYVKDVFTVCKVFIIVGIGSTIYHIYPHALTQLLDQLGIVVLLHYYLKLNNVPYTRLEAILVVLFTFLGVFNAVFMAITLIIYFGRLLGFLLLIGWRQKKFSWTVLGMAASGVFLASDIAFCKYQFFQYFHSLWHIGTQISFFMAIREMDYYHKFVLKKDVYIPVNNI